MKKIFTYIILLSFSGATMVSCSIGKNTGRGVGGTVVKTVATAAGLILLSKLLKSVLNTVTENTAFTGLSQDNQFITNFNEDTRLRSYEQNDFMKIALQVLVAEKYKIPLTAVVNNYNTLNTAGDLATFIGENADAGVLAEIK